MLCAFIRPGRCSFAAMQRHLNRFGCARKFIYRLTKSQKKNATTINSNLLDVERGNGVEHISMQNPVTARHKLGQQQKMFSAHDIRNYARSDLCLKFQSVGSLVGLVIFTQ